MGSCALFSYRSRYDAILFSNCTKELTFALFLCTAVRNLSDIILYSMTEQSMLSYVLTVLLIQEGINLKVVEEDINLEASGGRGGEGGGECIHHQEQLMTKNNPVADWILWKKSTNVCYGYHPVHIT